MSVKLGIAPIAWSNDDMPELGGETSLETCLSEARQAGFTGIESGGKFPRTSDELIPILNKKNNFFKIILNTMIIKSEQINLTVLSFVQNKDYNYF